MRLRRLLILSAAIAAAPGWARADLIQTTNEIVTGNLYTGNEVQGRTIVGGDIHVGNAENFAIGNDSVKPPSFNGSNALVVAGNIDGGGFHSLQVKGGDALVSYTPSNTQVQMFSGTLTVDHSAASSIATQAASQITNLSNYYSGLTANSVVPALGNQPTGVTFNAVAGANGVAVFKVDGSLFSNNNAQQFDINMHGATTVVINVTGGSDVNFDGGNFVGNFALNAANIIFNFENATTVETSRHIFGSLLAPNATLTNGTAIEGSVFVQNLYQNGEVHLPNFAGYDPHIGAVPIPASALLLGLGLPGGVIASWVSKRRRSA